MPPPQTLGDRYRLGGVLGTGGMATVYDAYEPALDRSVAVKVMDPELAKDPELLSRFLYEARILGQMDHPGVLPVYAAGSMADQRAYYAMKKVRGRTLGDILDGPRRLDRSAAQHTAEMLDILAKVCQTVAYAHSLGIVHRDLKPRNIMVDDFGVVIVLDWGLSKKIDQDVREQGILATQPGVVKGTPAYMSPEQAKGKPDEVDLRTDVFALGIILYQILTGRMPFQGQTHTQVLEAIKERQPPDPRRINRRASHTLAAVCMKALSKDPDERYPSAKEMAEDLERYRDHVETSAYHPGPLARLFNWLYRHPVLGTAIGTAAALVLVFCGLLWHLSVADDIRRTEEQERQRALVEQERKNQGERQRALLEQERKNQRERQRLREELEAKRLQEDIRKAMVEVQGVLGRLRDIDSKIAVARSAQIQPGPGEAARRKAREQQVETLKTARYEVGNGLRSAMTKLFLLLRTETGGDMTQIGPEILDFVRQLAKDELSSHIARGDFYRAHLTLHLHLVRYAEFLKWSDAETAELTKMKAEIEKALKGKYEGAFQAPDWDALGFGKRPPPRR